MRTIICLKYGTLYPAEYVNVLARACRAHMTGDLRFVCLTDDGAGIDADVDVLPIPDVGLAPDQWWIGGVWPKLGIFADPLHDLTGRCLFVDLDMIICGSLDPFFDVQGDLVGINCNEDWGKGQSSLPPRLGTGVIAFDAGGLAFIADHFRAERDAVIARLRQEQMYVAEQVSDLRFWPDPWVASFKRTLRQPIGLDLIKEPKEPPNDARIIAFHGTPRPIDLIRGRPFFWDRFPHMGHGQVRWLRAYWQRYGGS